MGRCRRSVTHSLGPKACSRSLSDDRYPSTINVWNIIFNPPKAVLQKEAIRAGSNDRSLCSSLLGSNTSMIRMICLGYIPIWDFRAETVMPWDKSPVETFGPEGPTFVRLGMKLLKYRHDNKISSVNQIQTLGRNTSTTRWSTIDFLPSEYSWPCTF